MGRTRYNIGDVVKYKGKKTYIKEILSVGKPTLYILPNNVTIIAGDLRKWGI